jgi:hypothetical protein
VRRSTFAVLFLLLLSMLMSAQGAPPAPVSGTPAFEVGFGYQYTRVNPGGVVDGVSAHGWDASAAANFNHWLGLKADFSGAYHGDLFGTNVNGDLHTFTFGPEFSYRSEEDKWKAYFHLLFGGAHVSGGTFDDSAFAMRVGGGGDWYFNKRLGWRVLQADYMPTHFSTFASDSWQSNWGVSTGIVLRFGNR